jgi:hypothetical protein
MKAWVSLTIKLKLDVVKLDAYMWAYCKHLHALRISPEQSFSPRTHDLGHTSLNYMIPTANYFDSWLACFTGGLRNPGSNLRRTILGTSLQMMQQWTGVNFIFCFGTTFFVSGYGIFADIVCLYIGKWPADDGP